MSNDLKVRVSLVDAFSHVSKNLTKQVKSMEYSFKSAKGQIGGVFGSLRKIETLIAAGAIGTLTASIISASNEFKALENQISAAVGKYTDATKELSWIQIESNRIGVEFKKTSGEFVKFAAAATRSGMSMEEVRKIFSDFSETAVSMQLSPERVKLIFEALSQMSSKGVVSMEELRRQLGDSLPGALGIAAKSMNVTSAELIKLVSTGKVMAAEFLPNFATAVREELGGSFEKASTQLRANVSRMKNALFILKKNFGEALDPIANEIVKSLGEKFIELKEVIEKNKDKITEAIRNVPEYFEKAYDALKTLVSFISYHKNTISMVFFVAASAKIIIAINAIRAAFVKLTMTMLSNPYIAVGAAILALGVIIYKVNKKRQRSIDLQKAMNEEMSSTQKISEESRKAWEREADAIVRLNKENDKRILLIKEHRRMLQGGSFTPEEAKKYYDELKRRSEAYNDGETNSYAQLARSRKKYEEEGVKKYKTPERDKLDGSDSKKNKKLEAAARKAAAERKRKYNEYTRELNEYTRLDNSYHKRKFDEKVAALEQEYNVNEMFKAVKINSIEDESQRELEALKHKYEKIREEHKYTASQLKLIDKAYYLEKATIEKNAALLTKKKDRESNGILIRSLNTLAGKVKEFSYLYKAAAISQIISDTHAAASKVWAATIDKFAWLGAGALVPASIAAGVVTGAGLVRSNIVANQKFANGTTSFMTNGPTSMIIGDNPGGVEEVSVRPVSSQNVSGPSGNGGNYTFNIYDNTGGITETLRGQINAGAGDRLLRELSARMAMVVA